MIVNHEDAHRSRFIVRRFWFIHATIFT
jgi:hypothetical protein